VGVSWVIEFLPAFLLVNPPLLHLLCGGVVMPHAVYTLTRLTSKQLACPLRRSPLWRFPAGFQSSALTDQAARETPHAKDTAAFPAKCQFMGTIDL
jgi:hypothetical protein